MGIRERLRAARDALLGISAYEVTQPVGVPLDDEAVEKIRKSLGGQLQPLPTTSLRWYLKDLETAQAEADAGNLTHAARLCNAMRRDGKLAGLLDTRGDSLIRLPKRFYGNEEIADALRSRNTSRSAFEEMLPPNELSAINADGIQLGVAVGELVPVKGRDYPVLVRLDPEFLQYRWTENRWYYQSVAGLLPITPGDGQWVMHFVGGRIAPWRYGKWPATGRNFINKDHAQQHRANFSAKLANPARVATAPIGASQPERAGMLSMVMRWAINSVFELPPGWDVKILETRGEGWKVFQEEIDTCDREYMVLLAGQEVTTTGGTGFSSQEMPEMIRQDIVAADAERLQYTINTQAIPLFTVLRKGEEALKTPTWFEWQTGRAKDLEGEGRTLQQAAQGLAQLVETLAPFNVEVDVVQLCERFSIPLVGKTPNLSQQAPAQAATPRLSREPTPEGKARAEEAVAQQEDAVRRAA